jgi:hypothetical protein
MRSCADGATGHNCYLRELIAVVTARAHREYGPVSSPPFSSSCRNKGRGGETVFPVGSFDARGALT